MVIVAYVCVVMSCDVCDLIIEYSGKRIHRRRKTCKWFFEVWMEWV